MCVLSMDVTMHNNAYIYDIYMCVCVRVYIYIYVYIYVCVCVTAIYVYLTGIINQQTL